MPPSTKISLAAMKLLSSEARKAATFATSSSVPVRARGVMLAAYAMKLFSASRLAVAFSCAGERKRVELFRDFVRRSGFHNCAGASGVTAKPDLSNQTDRIEVTYHLELRLPEVCGSRLFPLSGCQENRVMNCILSAPVDTSICLHLARYQHMLLNQDGDHHMNERTRHARGRCHCTELRKA